MDETTYLHLKPGEAPPQLEGADYSKALLVIEGGVTPDWQAAVSDWLVLNGCRYMMAWGIKCSEWDTSVDIANLRAFGYGEIPDDGFVMTTWHERDSLEEACWFAAHAAVHESLPLEK